MIEPFLIIIRMMENADLKLVEDERKAKERENKRANRRGIGSKTRRR